MVRLSIILRLVTLIVLIPLVVVAQGHEQDSEENRSGSSKMRSAKTVEHYRLSVGPIISHERIRAERSGSRTQIETQQSAVEFRLAYAKRIHRTRWQNYHSLALAIGTLKGKGSTVTIPDELDQQPWLSATLAPGVLYRSSPSSEAGIALPLSYRQIQWRLASGSDLSLDKQNSFSFGLALVYINRFTTRSALCVQIVRHHLWDSTTWSIGWEYLWK